MFMRNTVSRWLVAVAVAAGLGFATGSSVAADKKEGIIIQVSEKDPAKWNLALNVAENIQAERGKDKVDVEIVAFGPGLGMLLLDTQVGPRLKKAKKEGVMLTACGNTMRKTKKTDKDLYDGVVVKKAGVIAIMDRQNQGWHYVVP